MKIPARMTREMFTLNSFQFQKRRKKRRGRSRTTMNKLTTVNGPRETEEAERPLAETIMNKLTTMKGARNLQFA